MFTIPEVALSNTNFVKITPTWTNQDKINSTYLSFRSVSNASTAF